MEITIADAVVLGVIQGATEFLPISSSGHLILVQNLMGLEFGELKAFDIAVHVGTLLAIVLYFWRDFVELAKAGWSLLAGKSVNGMESGVKEKRGFLLYLPLATIPAVLVGAGAEEQIDAVMRNPVAVSMMLIIVGLLFFVVEAVYARVGREKANLRNSLLIGFAQALALVPGVSRSGITISAGIAQGVERAEAARFSFLLGSVAIVAASAYGLFKGYTGDFFVPAPEVLVAGGVAAFAVGYAAMAFLMRFLKQNSLHLFGWYRIILGVLILAIYWNS